MFASLSSKRFATPGSIILASLSSKHGQQLKLYGLAERQHKQIVKEEIQAFWQLKLYGLAERQPVRNHPVRIIPSEEASKHTDIIPSERSNKTHRKNHPLKPAENASCNERIIHLSHHPPSKSLQLLAAFKRFGSSSRCLDGGGKEALWQLQ